MITWLMACIALAGTFLNLKKRREGFALWIISNGYWVAHNFCIKEYAQSLLYFTFLTLAVWGLASWKNNENKNNL